ncbi:hypothetical protein G9A89_008942 [Geosiphon pyriformis]|nr:hypothetical protein G9A89_008942 [Geosiphon pyriformis]
MNTTTRRETPIWSEPKFIRTVVRLGISFRVCLGIRDLRETQTNDTFHAISIDPGIRTPFTWYSPSKGVGKIGEHDIGCIKSSTHSTSKRKKSKARDFDKAAIAFFICEFDSIIIPSFEVSNMANRKIRKITRKTPKAEEFGVYIIAQNEAYDFSGHCLREP